MGEYLDPYLDRENDINYNETALPGSCSSPQNPSEGDRHYTARLRKIFQVSHS